MVKNVVSLHFFQVDEIFGTLRDYYISVKLSEDVKVKSFDKNTKVRKPFYDFVCIAYCNANPSVFSLFRYS